jgi:hypothetical protein
LFPLFGLWPGGDAEKSSGDNECKIPCSHRATPFEPEGWDQKRRLRK